MSEDPCASQDLEYKAAMTEWVAASEACKEFVITEPLTPGKDIPLQPRDWFERMAITYDREEIARKTYFEKVWALLDCRKAG